MLRVTPIVVSLVLVLAFILPSFVLFEPPESGETISLKLMAVIAFAAFGIAMALFRVFGSWWRTRRLIGEWSSNAVPIDIESTKLPVFKLRHTFPVFAVVGVLRPRIFVAEQVLAELESSEVKAVIEHEFGHIAARDNLKGLLMKMCGDLLVIPIGRSLERNWSQTAERAADDYAVENGDRTTALHLASALIKIARLFPEKALPPMPSVSFVWQFDDSLAVRIRRLLSLADQDSFATKPTRHYFAPCFLVAGAFLVVLATNAQLLETVHNMSETILAILR